MPISKISKSQKSTNDGLIISDKRSECVYLTNDRPQGVASFQVFSKAKNASMLSGFYKNKSNWENGNGYKWSCQ